MFLEFTIIAQGLVLVKHFIVNFSQVINDDSNVFQE